MLRWYGTTSPRKFLARSWTDSYSPGRAHEAEAALLRSAQVSKETYYSGTRDLLCADSFSPGRALEAETALLRCLNKRQKRRRPATGAKKTYYRGKRDLL